MKRLKENEQIKKIRSMYQEVTGFFCILLNTFSVKSPSKDIFSGMDSDAFYSCVEDYSDDQSEIKDSKGRIFHEITNENEISFAKDLNKNLNKYETPNAQKSSKIIHEEKSFYKTPSDENSVKKEKTVFMTPLDKFEASQCRSATKYYTPGYVPHSPAPRSGNLEDITNRLSNLLDNIRYNLLIRKICKIYIQTNESNDA